MKNRFGKISLVVLFTVVISLLALNLIVLPISATPIHSNETTKLGSFTGPVGGTAQDDNVKASLDLAHTDLDTIATAAALNQDYLDNTTLVAGKTYSLQITGVNVGDEDLFLVAGGPILITSLVGEVTTVFDTSAATSKIMIDATSGLDYDFSTAVDLTDAVDGGRFVFTNVNPSVLTPLGLTTAGSGNLMDPWYCVPGMIEVVDSDDNDSTGATTWSITFIPLTSGVTVVAQ